MKTKHTITLTALELDELLYTAGEGYGAGERYTDKSQPNTPAEHRAFVRAMNKLRNARYPQKETK